MMYDLWGYVLKSYGVIIGNLSHVATNCKDVIDAHLMDNDISGGLQTTSSCKISLYRRGRINIYTPCILYIIYMEYCIYYGVIQYTLSSLSLLLEIINSYD